MTERAPADFHAQLRALDEGGLLTRIDRPICKDTELHPMARWQFTGGLPDSARRAIMFTNVHGVDGRKYDMPVVVGALAASPEIYSIGMGVPVEEIGDVWTRGIDHPIAPEPAAAAADRILSTPWPLRRWSPPTGVRLVATDTDWSYGSGTERAAPMEEHLLAMTGRTSSPASGAATPHPVRTDAQEER